MRENTAGVSAAQPLESPTISQPMDAASAAKMIAPMSAGIRNLARVGGGGISVIEIYAFTPAPVAFGAVGSRGQRGLGAKSRLSTRPAWSRSSPAQAIMAPLSVQSSSG